MTKIHYSILEAIQERFGWLLSDTQKISFNTSKRIGNRSADIGLIKAELRGVFNDAKIHTLKNLIKFLEDDFTTGDNEAVSYGFSDFQYVWEHMLRSVLSPTHAFVDMPIPAYRESSGREIKVGQKGQRVDIFLYEPINKEACVIAVSYTHLTLPTKRIV